MNEKNPLFPASWWGGPHGICHVALFHAFDCSVTATIQLAKCFPFLMLSSHACHCTNPWSVVPKCPPETFLSVSVVYSCCSIPMVIRIPILKWDYSSSKTSHMLCWVCWWGDASYQVPPCSAGMLMRSFWVAKRDLYLAGDVLWFWGWHCLGFSSGRFLKMLWHRCFQVLLPNLRVFLPHCDQRITRLPEWSSGHLAPCCNGIIWYSLNWIEWCGTAAICKEWGSPYPGRANSSLFSVHTS